MGLVEGLTASVEGLDKLMSEAGTLLPALLRLIGADRDTSRAALTALINLCQARALLSCPSPRPAAWLACFLNMLSPCERVL